MKETWGSKPRPTVTDAQWQEFKAMTPRDKLAVLHEHDAYYEGVRRRWQAESGLGAASAAAWLRQLSLWTGEANAQQDAMLQAKGLA